LFAWEWIIMKIVSGVKMAQIDSEAMSTYAIPGLVLMENAALQVVNLVRELRPQPDKGKVGVFCGRGNNGGDGFVIARHLRRLGYRVETWAMGGLSAYRGDAAVNYGILLKGGSGIHLVEESDPARFLSELGPSDLVVDALLGTGLKSPVSGPFEKLIAAINESEAEVLAVDIPSGISADSGAVMGAAVKADWTVTFALPKRGLLLFPGAAHAGRVAVVDIGIPAALTAAPEIRENLVTGELVRSQLPPRVTDGHKGTYGRVLILAGSPGMTGAAALAGEAALRGGAGLVYTGTAAELRPVLESKLKEVIVFGFRGDGRGNLVSGALGEILESARGCQALAFGPGLDPGTETLELLRELLRELTVPVVVDAGGLGAAARKPALLAGHRAPLVLTPHPGEMAALTGLTTADVQNRRWEMAAEMAGEWDAVLVLKGAHTVTAAPSGDVYINPTGNPVLSTAGSGDLLTGLLAALAAQGLSPEAAALCAVYLHGLAADMLSEWAGVKTAAGARGGMAGDVLEFFPAALNRTANYPPAVPGERFWIKERVERMDIK